MTKSQKEMQKMQQYERMIKAGKSVDLHLFSNAPTTAITKAASRLRATYQRAFKEISLTGLPDTKKDEARAEIKQAAKIELSQVIAQERQSIAEKIDRLKQNYDAADRRRRIETDRETTRYIRHIEAMASNELQAEAAGVLSGKKAISPDQFDELSRAVKQLDPHLHKDLREKADSLHAYSPWLNTDEGKELLKLDKALAGAANGDHVPIKTEDGYQLLGTDEILIREV